MKQHRPPVEPDVVATYEVPHPESLTMQELDEVLIMTGIDIAEAQASGIGMGGRVLAALVTWSRRRGGETVTFDEVYRTLRGNQIRLTKLDPPQTG